jgi:glycosyltransferase involved in cell wall biosynthesis
LDLRQRVVIYAGRFVESKGIEILLQAYQRLSDRSKTSLLLVGGGPLEESARGIEGVRVVGAVRPSELAPLLSLAEVVVLPSLTTPAWKEQFGRVLIEAMACGVPVVGSDSGEIPNLINATGGGIVSPEGDPVALAHNIDLLMSDLPLRMLLAERGLAAVRLQYSSAHQSANIERALTEVLIRHHGLAPPS